MFDKRLCICCYEIKDDSSFYVACQRCGVCSSCFRTYRNRIAFLIKKLRNKSQLDFYNKEFERILKENNKKHHSE